MWVERGAGDGLKFLAGCGVFREQEDGVTGNYKGRGWRREREWGKKVE